MKTRPKQLGTAWESWLVARFNDAGLTAWRLAEGGDKDAGDLVVADRDNDRWVIEAKATEKGNVTRWLAKAKAKTATADLPFVPAGTAVAWKRLINRGGERRGPDGERHVIILDLDTFIQLLGGDTT